MEVEDSVLDQKQAAYRTAVEEWIAAIREEEALASGDHSVAEIDRWEEAHFREEKLRNRTKAAKKEYEDALREKFFGFSRAAGATRQSLQNRKVSHSTGICLAGTAPLKPTPGLNGPPSEYVVSGNLSARMTGYG